MGRPWAIIDTAPPKSMSPQQDPMVRRPSHHRRGSGAEKNSTAALRYVKLFSLRRRQARGDSAPRCAAANSA
jgi:hypothetical protein